MRKLVAHRGMTVRSVGVAALLAVGIAQTWAQQQPAAGRHRHGRAWDFTPLEGVSEKDRARQNPLEGDPEAARAGQKLFTQHCAECHGENLEGTNRGISLLSEEVRQAPPGALFWILTNGVTRRGMPFWTKLPELQRWQLVAFLKSGVVD
jgi:cytochrome c oxidase cbb3-type subunit 2